MKIKNLIPMDALYDVSIITAGKFFVYTSAFLYTIVAARLLGPDGYGRLIAVMSAVHIFAMFFNFKFARPIVKLVGDRLSGESDISVSTIVKSSAIIQSFGAIIFILVVYLFLIIFAEKFDLIASWRTAIGLYALAEFIHLIRTLFNQVLKAYQKFTIYSVSTVFENSSRDIFPIILIILANVYGHNGIQAACLGYLIAEVVNVFFILFLHAIVWRGRLLRTIRMNFTQIKDAGEKLIYNTRSNYLAQICKGGFSNGANLIIGEMVGTEGVGFYNIAKKFNKIFTFIRHPLDTYLFPRFVEKWNKNKKEFFYTLRKYFYQVTATGITITILIAISSPWLITLIYGVEYEPSVLALWIMLPGFCLTMIFSIFQSVAFSVSEQRSILNIALIELFLGIPIIFILVAQFGYIGAAMALTFKSFVIITFKVRFLFKKFGRKWILP